MGLSGFMTILERITVSDFAPILLQNSKDMIFIKDERFRIIYANNAFLNMYAPEKRGAIIGSTTIEDFSEEEAAVFLREDQKALRYGSAELIEELTDYRGIKRIYQTQKIRFVDKSGRVLMLGICNEISKWAERERALAQSNLALENFAAIAAHDLRSPLGSLLSGIELIRLDKANTLTEASQNILNMMKTSAEGLVEQIGNLLSAYKTDHSGDLEKSPTDVGVLLEEVKFNLSQIITRSEANIRSTTMPTIQADKNLFRQLLHNLVENSIKYRSEEKPIIIVRYEKTKDDHFFTVEDNGIGIRREEREKIFDLYEQTSQGLGGFGIGLSLCRKIVELHGGKIWIDTFYKQGCKICFTIPEAVQDDAISPNLLKADTIL